MSGRNGWAPPVPLGEVLTKNTATTEVVADVQYREVTVKLWGRGVVERRTVLGSEIAADRRSIIRKDQFILSRIDARNGATGIVPSELDAAIVSNDFPTFDAVPGKLLPSYLGWLSKTPGFVETCKRASEGTTNRVRLKEEEFLRQTIPLPPLAEQQRIVTKIERLAGKIEEAAALRAKSADLADQLCRSLIHDNTDVSKPTRLAELVSWRKPDILVQPSEMYHFAGVYCFGRGVFKGDAKTGLEFSYAKLSRIRTGNFIYPKLMAWEGALGVVPDECDGLYVSPEFPVFEVNETKVLPEVLDVYFRSPTVWPRLSGSSTGTNVRRRRINPKDFLAFEMPLPPMDVQQRLRRVRKALLGTAGERTSVTSRLNAFLPSILDRAFRGELVTDNRISSASTSNADQQLAKTAIVYIVMLLRYWNAPVARNVLDACLTLMLNDQARKKILGSDSFKTSSAAGKSASPLRGLDNLLREMQVRQSIQIITRKGQQFIALGQQAPTRDNERLKERVSETITAFEIVGEDRATDVLAEMIDTTYELVPT